MVSPEGIEEGDISTVFLRTSWGGHFRVGPGPPLLTGFLGESELGGFGSSVVNSDSEDLKRIGRAANDKFPSLIDAPQIGWICSSAGQMQPLTPPGPQMSNP